MLVKVLAVFVTNILYLLTLASCTIIHLSPTSMLPVQDLKRDVLSGGKNIGEENSYRAKVLGFQTI